MFLFDEPLSNLDAELRVEMRVEIARLHREIGATMIYVTHDQVEAMTLADKIVVLRAGRIEQVGAPMDLYHDPDNRFVAGFIGSPAMNFLDGVVRGGQVEVPALKRSLALPVVMPADGTAVHLGLRPEHLTLDPSGDTHRVDLTEALGGVSYAYLKSPGGGASVIVEERGDERSRAGSAAGLSFDLGRAYLFDAKSGLGSGRRKRGALPPAELSLGSPRGICPEMKQGSGAPPFISVQIPPPEAPSRRAGGPQARQGKSRRRRGRGASAVRRRRPAAWRSRPRPSCRCRGGVRAGKGPASSARRASGRIGPGRAASASR